MKRLLVLAMALFLLGGCTRSVVDVELSETKNDVPKIGKEVYIGPIVDRRVFEYKPRHPSIPSLQPGQDDTPGIRLRAIGRVRGGWGKARADVLLNNGTVETLTTDAVRQTFTELGYTVITDKDQITEDTIVVEGTIDKFWTYMAMGFPAATFHGSMATTLTVKPLKDGSIRTEVSAACSARLSHVVNQTRDCSSRALQMYMEELKKNFE